MNKWAKIAGLLMLPAGLALVAVYLWKTEREAWEKSFLKWQKVKDVDEETPPYDPPY